MPSIIAKNLSKTYRITKRQLFKKETKEIKALKDATFEVYEGEIFGLLGPNGAGKTTLIKILTTLLIPDSGTAIVNGYDIFKEPKKVRASIGVMLMGERSLYWKLTGRENLEYFANLYKLPRSIIKKRVNEIIDFLEIHEFIDRLVETYSSGQKMLLAFAKALINDAPLIFLDEPTVAMDPRNALKVREKIRKLNEEYGKTIFLTTHLMFEAEQLCDRVAIIDRGRIIAIGSPDELKRTVKGKSSIEVDFISNKAEKIVTQIRALEGVISVADTIERSNGKEVTKLKILCNSPRELLPTIIEKLVEIRANILYINPREPTLEDVFMFYTGRLLSEDTREAR